MEEGWQILQAGRPKRQAATVAPPPKKAKPQQNVATPQQNLPAPVWTDDIEIVLSSESSASEYASAVSQS